MAQYAIVKINGNATPATITWGNITAGTGTIKTFTSNNTVIGSGTTFTTQLGNLYAIRNSANVYVGKISNIANNTYATLTTNANVAISSAAFKYQSYTATAITYDPNAGNGNISTYSTNSSVIGTNSTFLTQLNIGYQLFDSTAGNLIGVIKSVTDNTHATLTTVSAYPAVSIPFRFYDPNSNSKPVHVAPNNDKIIGALMDWGRSGLIQNITQVKSFHPPVPDPVTGILVNFPATIHKSKKIGNIVAHSFDDNHLDNIPNFQTSAGNVNVKLFDEDHGIVEGSTKKAIKSVPINKLINKMADMPNGTDSFGTSVSTIINTVYGTPDLNTPRGLVLDQVPAGFEIFPLMNNINSPYVAYQGPGGNIIYVPNDTVISSHVNTSVDKLSVIMNRPPPPRMTDSLEDAKAYYNVHGAADGLSDIERVNLPARASDNFAIAGKKIMASTGVPVVVPGQLNVVLYDEDPRNRQYVKPSYTEEFINIVNPMNYNPDLPISPLNEPPVPL